MAARRAKAKRLEERSILSGTQLLENCVHIKRLNTALSSIKKICDNKNNVFFKKMNAAVLN